VAESSSTAKDVGDVEDVVIRDRRICRRRHVLPYAIHQQSGELWPGRSDIARFVRYEEAKNPEQARKVVLET